MDDRGARARALLPPRVRANAWRDGPRGVGRRWEGRGTARRHARGKGGGRRSSRCYTVLRRVAACCAAFAAKAAVVDMLLSKQRVIAAIQTLMDKAHICDGPAAGLCPHRCHIRNRDGARPMPTSASGLGSASGRDWGHCATPFRHDSNELPSSFARVSERARPARAGANSCAIRCSAYSVRVNGSISEHSGAAACRDAE